MTTRREREIIELKNQIINQSWKIISEEGWQALSIRKIADAIEYSVPVIYKHFENKEAIIEYFSKEGFSILAKSIHDDIQTIADPQQKLRTIARSYWAFAANNAQHYRIMFGLGIPPCEAINSNAEMKETSQYMYDAIQQVLEESNNENADKYLKLKTFWSMLHGFIAIELLSNNTISNHPTATVEDAVDGFIFTLIYQNK